MAKTIGELFPNDLRRSPPSISSRPLVTPADMMSDSDSHDVPSLTNFEIRSSRRCLVGRYCLPLCLAAGILLVGVAVALAVGLTWRPPPPPPRVVTPCGEVVGDVHSGVYRFLGLPYAQPPVGKLRFRRPRDVYVSGSCQADGPSPRAAKTAPPPCLQRQPLTGAVVGQEDCLYLNVYSPDIRPGTRRPVIVVVGGLLFLYGGADSPGFRVTPDLVRSTGAVHVTVNYRLGTMGFLPVGDANVGLWDVVSALRWVKSFIGRFGGDSNNVMLFGYGSGSTAALVLSLAASDITFDLFHKVWLASPMLRVNHSRADAVASYRQRFGCISQSCLQNKTKAALVSMMKINAPMRRAWFELPQTRYPTPDPQILLLDDLLIRHSPVNASRLRLRDMSMVIGSTSNEVDVYLRPSGVRLWKAEDYEDYVKSSLSPSAADFAALRSLYPLRNSSGLESVYTSLVTDARVTCPLLCFAAQLRPNTLRLYQYVLTGGGRYVDPYQFEFRVNNSFHGWDALLYFSDGSLDRLASAAASPEEVKTRNRLRTAVRQLAWSGSVDQFQSSGMNVISRHGVEAESDFKAAQCRLWRKLSAGLCYRYAWAA